MNYATASTNGSVTEPISSHNNGTRNNVVNIEQLWQTIMVEIRDLEDSASLRKITLPFGRVKKIMKIEDVALQEMKRIAEEEEESTIKSSEDKNVSEQKKCLFMIAEESPYVMAKAADMFIRDITTRAWMHADTTRRKTIQKSDLIHAASESEIFDFLIDVIPRFASPDVNNNNNTNSTTATSTTTEATTAATPAMYGMPFQYNPTVQQPPPPPTTTATNMVQIETLQQQEESTNVPEVQQQQQQQQMQVTDYSESYGEESRHHDVQQHQQQLHHELEFTADVIFPPGSEEQQQPQNYHLDDTPAMLEMDDLQQQQQQDSTDGCYETSSSPHPQQWTFK